MFGFQVQIWALLLSVAVYPVRSFSSGIHGNTFEKRDTVYLPNTGLGSPSPPYTTAQNATVFALVYGSPLPDVVNVSIPILSVMGTNNFFHTNTTANAASAEIVRPNVDTVYSGLIVDLSHEDVSVTVPLITDGRFYVVPFYDIYGNDFANVGSITASKPGKYLMRRAQDANVQPGLQLTNIPAGYQGVINFPTTYGFIILRILLRNRGSDIETVRAYQTSFNTSLVKRSYTCSPQAPQLSLELLTSNLTGSPPERLLQLTARLAPFNQPEITSAIKNITRILELAGLKDGIYTQPANTNLSNAAAIAQLTILADLNKPGRKVDFGNGWNAFTPEVSGNFGTDFAVCAYIAATGIAQLTNQQTIYPTFVSESSNNGNASNIGFLSIASNEAIIFTFSRKPPVTGFWSLTAYGSDYYLPANVTPPSNWTKNWLPAPSGGGEFLVNLRWYGPTPAFTNGSNTAASFPFYAGPSLLHPLFIKRLSQRHNLNSMTSDIPATKDLSDIRASVHCYALPYGATGCASQILTYYCLMANALGRKPLMPWKFQQYNYFNIVIGIGQLVGSCYTSGLTVSRCKGSKEMQLLGIWMTPTSIAAGIASTLSHGRWIGTTRKTLPAESSHDLIIGVSPDHQAAENFQLKPFQGQGYASVPPSAMNYQ
ncbi:hypothetical protein G7Y89_g8408 [Cudoniella acicularis]|uniref:Uncharacterized protein n=1 Tax=Cudoniella acicularis TaxID=354080 RepID=A0A8H4RJ63_9HELO|nr:hypothetical protein G7Y89_g8408 [Cudoniella acicularis]